MRFLFYVIFFLCLLAPNLQAEEVVFDLTSDKKFNDYWYPLGAEISRFSLKQSRYGELHQGDAVLIFVTEPMNPDLQVKADQNHKENVPILKLNLTRKFYTGVYPYSVMTSVFAPIQVEKYPLPLKISFTSQEWCGHVFMQLNLGFDGYKVEHRSYFETESDNLFGVARVISEDALWTLIRIAPQKLPQGVFKILPSATYARLMHKPFKVSSVTGSIARTRGKSLEGNPLVKYQVKFGDGDRSLEIFFEADFPHRIQQWTEKGKPLKYFGNKSLTTTATRTHTIMTDYWNKNKNNHRPMLKDLGLTTNQ